MQERYSQLLTRLLWASLPLSDKLILPRSKSEMEEKLGETLSYLELIKIWYHLHPNASIDQFKSLLVQVNQMQLIEAREWLLLNVVAFRYDRSFSSTSIASSRDGRALYRECFQRVKELLSNNTASSSPGSSSGGFNAFEFLRTTAAFSSS